MPESECRCRSRDHTCRFWLNGPYSRDCRIQRLSNCPHQKSDFTFGRSLNYGCDAAIGDVLVFISAHCIPVDKTLLAHLVAPIFESAADYVCGRQVGHEVTKFSEHQVFAQYFPDHEVSPEEHGGFVNNANAALRRSIWADLRFDEEVTGLEDLECFQKPWSRREAR